MRQEMHDSRRKDIVDACAKLYQKENFKDITLKSISTQTPFSRTSIYNYFQTKEEIFLALFQREYEKWIEDLTKVFEKNETMDNEKFADEVSKTIEKRKTLLKLLSMNLYDMEENSRNERLVEFKVAYGNSIKTMRSGLDKYFTDMTEKDKEDFIFEFFPLMYGIYPYAVITTKQKKAMKEANMEFPTLTIKEIAYTGILKLLK